MGSKESKHEKAVSMSNQELKEENMECSATKDNATENNEIESQQDITNSDSSVHSLTAIDNEDQCLKFYEMYRKLLTNLPRDISKRRVSTPRNVCKKHTHPMPFNFFCETCFVPICSDCTVLCHDKTKGHDIKDIEIVLESHHDLMADLNAAKQRELSKLQINIGELERVKDLQDTNKDYVAKLINKKFEQYHKLLDQRKESLLEELSNQKADKASKLQSALQKSHQAAENLSKHLMALTSAVSHRNFEDIFQTYLDLNTVDLTSIFISQLSLSDLLTYVDKNEKDFKKAVLNVGEIKEEICRL